MIRTGSPCQTCGPCDFGATARVDVGYTAELSAVQPLIVDLCSGFSSTIIVQACSTNTNCGQGKHYLRSLLYNPQPFGLGGQCMAYPDLATGFAVPAGSDVSFCFWGQDTIPADGRVVEYIQWVQMCDGEPFNPTGWLKSSDAIRVGWSNP